MIRLLLAAVVLGLWALALPLLAIALALTDLTAWLRGRRRPRGQEPSAPPPPRTGVSVVIPSYNGQDLLAQCLPALLAALRGQPLPWEVLVVDNGSADDTVAWVRATHPAVRILPLPRNEGFSGGSNRGAAQAVHPLVLFLNNDMVVEPDFLAPLVAGFSDGSVFAVTSQIFFQDPDRRREETGLTRGELRWGELRLSHAAVPREAPGTLLPALYAGGGSSLVDRAKFLALGGFDAFYAPFYYEDADLSYRAWKRGWRVLFAWASRVHHRHRGTIGRLYTPEAIEAIRLTNEFRWVLRCVTDWRLLGAYLVLRPLPMLRLALAGRSAPLVALGRALSSLGPLLHRRGREAGSPVTDREVLEQTSAPAAYRQRWGLTGRRPGDPLRVLIVAPHFPYPLSHGGAVRLYNYIRHLSLRGVEVFLLTFIEQEHEREQLPELEKYCREVRQIRRIPTRSPHPVQLFAFRQYYVEAMADAIRELEMHHDFDVVQFEYTQMAVYQGVPRGSVARVMVEIDVTFVTLWRRARQVKGLARLAALGRAGLAFDAELTLARQMDRVFTMSERDAHLLQRFLPGLPTAVVPNGVDTAAHRFMARWHHRPTLLFVGYFLHPPNVEAALGFAAHVYPRIQVEVPEVRWLIAGAHPPPEIRALAQPGSGIRVLGYVEDLGPCYAESAVFLAPVTRGSGTRLKILEAMARGLPVVTTTVGAEGIAVTPEVDALIADTPAAFAAQVVRLLRDPDLAERLRRDARALVERRYDYARLVEELEAGYRLAMGDAARR